MRKDKALLLGSVCAVLAILQAPSAKATDAAPVSFAKDFVTAVVGQEVLNEIEMMLTARVGALVFNATHSATKTQG